MECSINKGPVLLILAAGMGSRYGGLKQLDSVGPHGETIMDYSIYDAIEAGFKKVIFIIRKDFEEAFREKILKKYTSKIDTEVIFQSLDALPKGFSVPEGREKPWGTNHAVLMALGHINTSFAVINADDFYGRNSFEVLAKKLQSGDKEKGKYYMVGFPIANTLSESGNVNRGIARINNNNLLIDVTERIGIHRSSNGEIICLDENHHQISIPEESLVSMNMWGFTPDYLVYSEDLFKKFLQEKGMELKSEYYIPTAISELIYNKKASVEVLSTSSQWYGVTYPQDRPALVEALSLMTKQGLYPESLFS